MDTQFDLNGNAHAVACPHWQPKALVEKAQRSDSRKFIDKLRILQKGFAE